MPRGNYQNLVQNKQRTPEERRESARKAGIASGDSRREKRAIREALQKRLSNNYSIGEKEDKQKLGGYEALAESMIVQAIKGNVAAFIAIRDSIGERPTDKFEFESSELTGIKINFVDKSGIRKGKEKDPKIVGDYTPSTNTEE